MRLVKKPLVNVLDEHLIDYTTPTTINHVWSSAIFLTLQSLWVFVGTSYIGYMPANRLLDSGLLGVLFTLALDKVSQLTVQTIFFIYAVIGRILGVVICSYARVSAKQFGSRLLNFSALFPLISDNISTPVLVYPVLFFSTCYILVELFGQSDHYVGNNLFQFPTFREYVLVTCDEFIAGPPYFAYFAILSSYSLVTWLGFSNHLFWIFFYLILIGFKRVLYAIVRVIAWGLICTNCIPLAFIGLRIKWATSYAWFDLRTSTAVCMVISLFLDTTLLEFGWKLMGMWSCCWLFPGLWARLILLIIYPVLYIFSVQLPLIWYICFATLHHHYTRFVFCISLLVGLGLLHLGWLGPCWAQYIRNFFFMGYALYGILAIPVTFENHGNIPTTVPQETIREGFNTSEYFVTFGGLVVPVTREAAVCAFQYPVVILLGVHWYTWAYGKGTYCGGRMHIYLKQQTLYHTLFRATSFILDPVWYIPCLAIPHTSFAEECRDLQKRLSILYEFRWNQDTRDRIHLQNP